MIANDDFKAMCADLGVTEEFVSSQSQFLGDRVDIPEDVFCLGDSPIHGTGVFARYPFEIGDLIGIGNLHGRRTQLGRYTNHHPTPNAMASWSEECIILTATREIHKGEEITVDYRQTRSVAMGGGR